MPQLTLRFVIALVMFTFGIVGVSLSYMYPHRGGEPLHVPFYDTTVYEEFGIAGYGKSAPFIAKPPEVKYLYISDPISWDKSNMTQDASIVIFYANGEWGRISPAIDRHDRKLSIGTAEGYRAEIGSWKETATGTLVISNERRKCYLCFVAKDRQNPMKLMVENWSLISGKLGQINGRLKSPNGKYRLLQVAELADQDSFERIVYAPLGVRNDNDQIGEDY